MDGNIIQRTHTHTHTHKLTPPRSSDLSRSRASILHTQVLYQKGFCSVVTAGQVFRHWSKVTLSSRVFSFSRSYIQQERERESDRERGREGRGKGRGRGREREREWERGRERERVIERERDTHRERTMIHTLLKVTEAVWAMILHTVQWWLCILTASLSKDTVDPNILFSPYTCQDENKLISQHTQYKSIVTLYIHLWTHVFSLLHYSVDGLNED